jgi:hypothetical protein
MYFTCNIRQFDKSVKIIKHKMLGLYKDNIKHGKKTNKKLRLIKEINIKDL